MLWTTQEQFLNHPFGREAELEAAIADVADVLFGANRVYLDVKKLVGAKGKTKNIPDGYLIDLTSKRDPRLFVIEVELASHDPLNHVAVQVLEFSLSFESSPYKVKSILKEALRNKTTAQQQCQRYAAANGFENVDFLLEQIVQRSDAFNALVIIDELEEELETLLLSRFKFPVEILTVERFRTKSGKVAYEFDPFLADLSGSPLTESKERKKASSDLDPAELDTIVVPAKKEGFEEVFIGQDRWYQIRIHSSMVPRIKYIAAYRTLPVSAITHVAEVKEIKLWQEGSKYVLNFAAPARQIGPIKLVPAPSGVVKAPQAPRYTSYARLQKAKNLDQVF